MRWKGWPIGRRERRTPERLPPHVKALLAPYFPGFDLDAVRVLEGIPWYVTMNADAYTDRTNIYFAPGKYDTETVAGIALIGHEIMHCVQYRERGTWSFRAAYSGCFARNFARHRSWNQAYLLNPFEEEARAVERRIYADLLNLTQNGEPDETPNS
jgi:hypothetical protein